jgi:transcriptional regulator with XRE-family HTH domain
MRRKNQEFGVLLKQLRLQAGYGLRRFASLIEMPASNLSAVEHGRRRIPADRLTPTAETLGLQKDTEAWTQFFDLAAKSDEMPADVQQIAQRGFVPALLRTIDNAQLSDEKIEHLIQEIQSGNA